MSQNPASVVRAATARLIEEGKFEAVGDYFSSEYVVHLTGQNLSGGHKTVQAVVKQLRLAFPQIRAEVEILMETADRVAWLRTLSGTQEGAYKGFPGQGRQLIWRDMVVSHVRNGLIEEEWVTTDLAEQLLLSRKR